MKGRFSDEMQAEMLVWRVIDAGYCTIEAVNSGSVTLRQLMKASALLDYKAAVQAAGIDKK